MERVSVRELSGDLVGRLGEGEILGVTHNGALAGVLVPWTKDIRERLAVHDAPATTARVRRARAMGEIAGSEPMDIRELIDAEASGAQPRSFSRLSIRELRGERLAEAARTAERLVITRDKVAVALFMPVDQRWIDRLVEESVSRFMQIPTAEERETPRTESSVGIVPRRESIRYPSQRFQRLRAIGIRIIGDAPNGGRRVVGLVTDGLANTKVPMRDLPLSNLNEDHVFAQIVSLVEALRDELDDDHELLGVGVEIGGHVDRGRVIQSANATWEHFPLAERLSSSLRLPVVLENDANSLAMYETDFHGVDDDNFALALITDLGVGGALVIGGRLYRGAFGMAGELGHVPVGWNDDPAEPCRCGNRSCLENFATPRAIKLALTERQYTAGYDEALRQPDNEIVREVFGRAGSALGRGITTMLNLFNPTALVIYGPPELIGTRSFRIGSYEPPPGVTGTYVKAMVDAIRAHTFSNGAEECKFVVRQSRDEQGAVAAAACLVHRIDDVPMVELVSQAVNAYAVR